jgi:hypothetical protein
MNPVLTALSLLIEEEIANVNFRPYKLLAMLKKADAFQTIIKWDANTGGATTGGRATTADPTVGQTDTVRDANLPIGSRVLNHTFSVLLNDIVQAKQTAPKALKNLFQSHVTTGFDVILPELNKALYTGTGNAASHGIFGLEYITDNTQIYAGLNPVTYPLWASYRNDNGGTARPISRQLLSAVDVGLERQGVAYNYIITTPEIVEKYGEAFAQDRALTTPQVNGIADLGFSGYSYKGKPILSDVHCPNGSMYFVNDRRLEVYTFNTSSALDNDESGMAKSEKTMGLNFQVSQLRNRNPDALEFEIAVKAQLKAHDRRCVAVLRDITQ